MNANKFVKKYTMVLALLVVFVFFTYLTGGRLLLAQNISNLLLQNAYVLIMACGMLLCILTGGNVDLSVGSTLCLSAALSAKLLSVGINPFIAILVSLAVACIIGIWQIYTYTSFYMYIGRYVLIQGYSQSYFGFKDCCYNG